MAFSATASYIGVEGLSSVDSNFLVDTWICGTVGSFKHTRDGNPKFVTNLSGWQSQKAEYFSFYLPVGPFCSVLLQIR